MAINRIIFFVRWWWLLATLADMSLTTLGLGFGWGGAKEGNPAALFTLWVGQFIAGDKTGGLFIFWLAVHLAVFIQWRVSACGPKWWRIIFCGLNVVGGVESAAFSAAWVMFGLGRTPPLWAQWPGPMGLFPVVTAIIVLATILAAVRCREK